MLRTSSPEAIRIRKRVLDELRNLRHENDRLAAILERTRDELMDAEKRAGKLQAQVIRLSPARKGRCVYCGKSTKGARCYAHRDLPLHGSLEGAA